MQLVVGSALCHAVQSMRLWFNMTFSYLPFDSRIEFSNRLAEIDY
jgi:hypothetical protein